MSAIRGRRRAAHRLTSLLNRGPRSVPAAVLPGSELIHLGGGEMVPCPGIESLPLAREARSLGLGSPSLALPPSKVHVLRDVKLCPGSRLVRTTDGRIVAESLTADMSGHVQLDDPADRRQPLDLPGTIALYRSPWRRLFHVLIDHVPRAALLSQPAMNRLGPVTLVHDGPLDPLEEFLLTRLLGRQVKLRQVDPSQPLRAERVLLPGFVTRPAAGAIPSWYRRWVDLLAASVPGTDGDRVLPRRFFVEWAGLDPHVRNRGPFEDVLRAHGIERLELSTLSAVDIVRLFRNAELVIGVTGGGLAGSVFSRSARVVELVPGQELLPHFFYLCASKRLPYEHLLAPADGLHLHPERRFQQGVEVDVAALDRLLTRLD